MVGSLIVPEGFARLSLTTAGREYCIAVKHYMQVTEIPPCGRDDKSKVAHITFFKVHLLFSEAVA